MTLITLLVFSNVQSQDLVIKKTGEELKVKITEISDTQLKYEKPGLTVAFTIPLADVLMVTFKNGEKFIPQVSEKSTAKSTNSQEIKNSQKSSCVKMSGSSMLNEKSWYILSIVSGY